MFVHSFGRRETWLIGIRKFFWTGFEKFERILKSLLFCKVYNVQTIVLIYLINSLWTFVLWNWKSFGFSSTIFLDVPTFVLQNWFKNIFIYYLKHTAVIDNLAFKSPKISSLIIPADWVDFAWNFSRFPTGDACQACWTWLTVLKAWHEFYCMVEICVELAQLLNMSFWNFNAMKICPCCY